MPGRGDNTNANDILLLALASGQSNSASAALAGVSESTVARRLRHPKFQARLLRMRTRIIESTLSRLLGKLGKACEKLDSLMDDVDPRVALQAVRTLLASTESLWKNVDQAKQLEALQDKLDKLLPKENIPTP